LLLRARHRASPGRSRRAVARRRDGGPGRPALRGARLRRLEACRARDRARRRAAASPHGRADRRHGAARAYRAHGAHRPPRARAGPRRPLHRARHGCRLRACRPRARARPRPSHCCRNARLGARRRQGARGLFGIRRGVRLMLSLARIDAFYGRAHILAGVSLAVGKGEVLALLGRNGAGKSTTLKTIIGLVPPAAGEILFEGRRVDGLTPNRIAQLGIGWVPEDRRIFTDLTVVENLEVGRQPPREDAPTWTAERLFALFPNLAELRNRSGGRISGG